LCRVEIESLQVFGESRFRPPSFALVGVKMSGIGSENRTLKETLTQRFTGWQLGLLLHDRDTQAGPALNLAVIKRSSPGDDSEKCRLARAIASDQSDSLTGSDGELGPVQQWTVAEGDVCVEKRDE
jgi:hypothetical protein